MSIKKRKRLTLEDLKKVPVFENQEPLVDVKKYDMGIVAEYKKQDMIIYFGDTILIRETLAKKIANVNIALRKRNLATKIVYGYRHPDVQEKYFNLQKARLKQGNQSMPNDELEMLTHNLVASPEVAGHPCGGALDLTLIDLITGTECEMGTEIAEYSDKEKITTFSQNISKNERVNRQILHDHMVEEGFAPFHGEWWHFSYGDREWAAFYEKQQSIYGVINSARLNAVGVDG